MAGLLITLFFNPCGGQKFRRVEENQFDLIRSDKYFKRTIQVNFSANVHDWEAFHIALSYKPRDKSSI